MTQLMFLMKAVSNTSKYLQVTACALLNFWKYTVNINVTRCIVTQNKSVERGS